MELITATDNDAGFIFDLFATQKILELHLDQIDRNSKDVLVDMQWQARNQSYNNQFPDLKTWIIRHENQAVGAVLLNQTPQDIRIVDIIISSNFRNLGIGTLLLKEIQANAQQNNLTIHLQVAISNPAQHLYKRLGFICDQTDPVYMSMRWVPCLF